MARATELYETERQRLKKNFEEREKDKILDFDVGSTKKTINGLHID